jgi:hypothetical protein
VQVFHLTLLEQEIADKISTFDSHAKVLPLATWELWSFVFQDLMITQHVPHIAVK